MIYLLYVEDRHGNTEINQCRDEVHYMDLLVDIESRAVIVPHDIRWHGDNISPPMRILAVGEGNDLLARTAEIIDQCATWLRRN